MDNAFKEIGATANAKVAFEEEKTNSIFQTEEVCTAARQRG